MLFLTYPISNDFENGLTRSSAGGSANWYHPLLKQFVKIHHESEKRHNPLAQFIYFQESSLRTIT